MSSAKVEVLVVFRGGDSDPRMMRLLAVNLREFGEADPDRALELFSRFVSLESIPLSSKEQALHELAAMGSDRSNELLAAIATSSADPELRRLARELLAR